MKKYLATAALIIVIGGVYAVHSYTAKADIFGSSLLAWWTLDSNDISGTSVTDKSGGGNTGTTGGSPTAVTGKLGQALSFNGSNQSITTTQMAGASSLTAATLSAWVYSLGNQNTYAGIVSSRTTGLLEIGVSNFSGVNMVWASWGGNALEYDANSGYTLPANKWVLITATFTSAGDVLYINGALQFNNTSITNSSQNENGVWNIGFDPTSALTRTFSGYIDDVRVYNRALSAAEIATLWYQGQSQHYNGAF